MSNATLTKLYVVMSVVWSLTAASYMGDALSVGVCVFAAAANAGGAAAHAWIDKL